MNAEDFITESPIETRMLAALLPHLRPDAAVQTQRPVTAGTQRYRVDIAVTAADRLVVIECDGRNFHDFAADRFRDVAMLDLGGVSDVARFRGSDINFDPTGCVERLRMFLPFLFDPAAGPLTGDALALGPAGMHGGHVLPIFRCRVAPANFPPGGTASLNLLGVSNDRQAVLVEMKSPYWGWEHTGPKTQVMGDIMEGVVDKLIADIERARDHNARTA